MQTSEKSLRLLQTGRELHNKGQQQDALETIEKGTYWGDDGMDALELHSMILFELGQYHESIQMHQQYLELYNQAAEAEYLNEYKKYLRFLYQYQAAPLLIAHNDKAWMDARTLYTAAIAIDPDDWINWYGKGVAELRLKRYKDAEQSFTQAMDRNKYNAHIRSGLAKALFRAFKVRSAIQVVLDSLKNRKLITFEL